MARKPRFTVDQLIALITAVGMILQGVGSILKDLMGK